MKLILLPRTDLITQGDMENVLVLTSQIERLVAIRDRVAATILARMASGADIEPGNRSCDIDETYNGRVRRQRLIVK